MLKYLLGFAFLTLSLAGVSMLGLAHSSKAGDGALRVVTTTAHLADLVENLNPGHLRIESLMGAGVDPHLYRPTSSDVLRLKRADIVFYNGLHLEGQMTELLETLGKEKPVIAVAAGLAPEDLLSGSATTVDPHIWMSVPLWKKALAVASRALSRHDTGNAPLYAKNAEIYGRKLDVLDRYIRTSLETIPEKFRTLITAHDAFGYFGNTYGIEVVGIQGLSTESEAGLKKIEILAHRIATEKIPAVFTETSVTDRNIKALIAGAKSRGHTVLPGETLYSDALGPQGTYEGTYIGMMEHNVNAITKALGGKPAGLLISDRLAARTP